MGDALIEYLIANSAVSKAAGAATAELLLYR